MLRVHIDHEFEKASVAHTNTHDEQKTDRHAMKKERNKALSRKNYNPLDASKILKEELLNEMNIEKRMNNTAIFLNP